MEKNNRSTLGRTVQESLQIQNSRIFQEQTVDRDELLSNQQFQKSEAPAQNESSEHEIRKLPQRVNKERKEKNPAQDTLQITEADGTSSQECSEFSEDEGLGKETVVDVIERQRVGRSARNSRSAQYTITRKANAGAHQECSIFAEEQLELESATMQKRTESSGKVLIAAASYSVQTAGHGANYVKQESDRNVENAHLEANAALQQESETSANLLILNWKSEQSCEVSENMKIREKQQIVMQQGSEASKNVLETREESGTRGSEASGKEHLMLTMLCNFFNQQQMEISHQKNTHSFDNSEEMERNQLGEIAISGESKDNMKIREEQKIVTQQGSGTPKEVLETGVKFEPRENEPSNREQLLLKMMGNFFNQQHQDNKQQMEIMHQENTHSLDNSEEIKPRQLGETTTSEETKDTRNFRPQDHEENMTECLSKSGCGVLARPRESKKDTIGRHLETKDDFKLKYGMNSHRRERQDVANLQKPKVNKCGLHRKSEDAIMHPQKIKDYVTALPTGSDNAIVRPQYSEDHETFIPQISDNHILPPSQWKNYVTIHPTGKKENVRMLPPRPVPEIKEPPTHILWHIRPFKEIQDFPKEPTRVCWPLERSPKTTSSPHRTRSNQARILQCRRLPQIPDEDELPLVPFEQGPVAAGGTEEPRVQRNRGILGVLMLPLLTGILGCMQRIREYCIPPERKAFFETLKARCLVLLYSLLIVSILATVLYFAITFAKSESLTSDSDITTPYYLDSTETAFVTNLDLKLTDFDCGVATPVNDFDVSVTTPLRDMAVNVVSPIKYVFCNITSPGKDC